MAAEPSVNLSQVLVVVLADWSVLCLDHMLRVVWNTRVRVRVCLKCSTFLPHAHKFDSC